MTTEEVISIAKTLRPGFLKERKSRTFMDTMWYELLYEEALMVKYFGGNSWEEALRAAGWKG